MSEYKPEILLVGTGAVGSFYGAKLAQAGARVSTLCRSDFDVVKKSGIHITSVMGDIHLAPQQVIKEASDYHGSPDYIIVATKVLPDINIPLIIKGAVRPATTIVLLQNGIDIEKNVAQAYPDNEIISGLAFICVSRPKPGIIVHQDFGRIVIGTYPNGITEKGKKLQDLFSTSGIDCTLDENVIAARWMKLVWNAPFNPISVLAGGADTKAMLESAPTRQVVQHIMEEVLLLAEKSGHPLPGEIVQKMIDDTLVMKPYKTSMLLDFENKRPLEVEAILGNAFRCAKKLKLSIPYIESLYGLLSLADRQNRSN